MLSSNGAKEFTRIISNVDMEVIFNRTLGVIGSAEFDLHGLFSHEWAQIPACDQPPQN